MSQEKLPQMQLLVELPDSPPTKVMLGEGDKVTVGRGEDQSIVVHDGGVSRAHALFELRAEGLMLFDNDSTNGSFLNGIRIVGKAVLKGGDKVTIGVAKFQVEEISTSPSEVPPPTTRTTQLRSVPLVVLVAGLVHYKKLATQFDEVTFSNKLKLWAEDTRPSLERFGGRIHSTEQDRLVAIWHGDNAAAFALQALKAALFIRKCNVTNPPLFMTSCALFHGKGLCDDTLQSEQILTIVGEPVEDGCLLQSKSRVYGSDILMGEAVAALVSGEIELDQLKDMTGSDGESKLSVYSVKQQVTTLGK